MYLQKIDYCVIYNEAMTYIYVCVCVCVAMGLCLQFVLVNLLSYLQITKVITLLCIHHSNNVTMNSLSQNTKCILQLTSVQLSILQWFSEETPRCQSVPAKILNCNIT